MPFFRLNSNSVFTLGGNAITHITGVDINEAADTFPSNSMDNTTKQHVVGLTAVTGTVNFEIEDDDVTALGYLDVGDAGAMVFQPNGTTTGDLDIDSTNMQILSRSLSFSTTGLTTGSCSVLFDDLAISANS